MIKKEITSKEKVEALKKNSKLASKEKSKTIIQNIEIKKEIKKEEKRKRKECKPLRSELKNIWTKFNKNFASFSICFTKMDLLLQLCILIPVLLIFLLICNRIFLYS